MNGIHTSLSTTTADPIWDAFVEQSPRGHYSQTSLWSQVKASSGWKAARITLADGDQILAGAQILFRSLPLLGSIAYLSKGPVFTTDDSEIADRLLQEIHAACRKFRIQYLAIQPPDNGEDFSQHLLRWKYHKTKDDNINPPGTLRIDLTQETEAILAGMRSGVRRKIVCSQRKGVVTQEGIADDLKLLHRCLVATSKRKQFTVNPEELLCKMWEVFNPPGYIKLFCAAYGKEPVSAMFAIAFKDTVTLWRHGWSGEHSNLHPNEGLYWEVIRWAKEHGYHYLDFGGIETPVALKLLQGEGMPESSKKSVTFFKLGFGGQVVFYPETYAYVFNPVFRILCNRVYPVIMDWPVKRKLINYFSKR